MAQWRDGDVDRLGDVYAQGAIATLAEAQYSAGMKCKVLLVRHAAEGFIHQPKLELLVVMDRRDCQKRPCM